MKIGKDKTGGGVLGENKGLESSGKGKRYKSSQK